MSDIDAPIASGMLFPVYERRKGRSSTAWRRLEQSHWLSLDDRQALQFADFHHFIAEAGRNAPFDRAHADTLQRTPAKFPRVCIVGPLAPSSGGMVNQCEQWPSLVPYHRRLWTAARRASVMHVMVNSGWVWHLLAGPAMTGLRGWPVIVNYRRGNADTSFATAPQFVFRMLADVALRVTPAVYLVRVFPQHGLGAEVVPNIIDLFRFAFSPALFTARAPHIVVPRNLEAMYDIETSIRAFVRIRQRFPEARMMIAGNGSELSRLRDSAESLSLGQSVHFTGIIDNADIVVLYAAAECSVNPSTVDNIPNWILEAFASGVPVIRTDADGIPDMVTPGVSALMVPTRDDAAMAQQMIRVLEEPALAQVLRRAGLAAVEQFVWPRVTAQWLDACRGAIADRTVA